MLKRISICISLIVIASCNSYLQNQDASIEIGKNYLLSEWENKDPFKKNEIDTVKVIDIIGEYVQYEYKNGYRSSTEMKIFKHRQKPCK